MFGIQSVSISADMETYPLKTKDVTSKHLTQPRRPSPPSPSDTWLSDEPKCGLENQDRHRNVMNMYIPGRQKRIWIQFQTSRGTLYILFTVNSFENEWILHQAIPFSLQVVKGLLKTQYDILFGVAVEINYSPSIFKLLYCDYFKITLLRKQELLEGGWKKKWREGNHRCDLTCGVISSSLLFLCYIACLDTSLENDIVNDFEMFSLKRRKEVSLWSSKFVT